MGNIFYSQNNIEKAFEAYKKAISIDLNNSVGYYNLGLCHEKQREWATAVRAFRRVICINREADDAYFRIGVILMKQGDFQNTRIFFNRSIQLNLESAEYKEARYEIEKLFRKNKDLNLDDVSIF